MLKRFLVQWAKTMTWCVIGSASLSGVGMMVLGFYNG